MPSNHTASKTGIDQDRLICGSVLGGGLLALFGIGALFASFLVGLSLAVALGASLVAGGLVHAATAFSAGSLLGW